VNPLRPLALVALFACARTPPPPVTSVDAPTSAPLSAPDELPDARAASPVPPKVRFLVVDQIARQDPKTNRETFWTKLDVMLDAKRLATVTLKEPSCRAAYEPAELEAPRGTPIGGLVCYHAGYGEYVVVAEDGDKLVVTTYGQHEPLPGNDPPKRLRERTLAQVPWTPGTRAAIELVESDGGAVLP
jgi:hypothetical protein